MSQKNTSEEDPTTTSKEQENSKQPNRASGGKRHPGTGGMKNKKGRGRSNSQKQQIPVKEFEGLKSSVETMKVEFSDISRLLKSMVNPATKKPRLEEPEVRILKIQTQLKTWVQLSLQTIQMELSLPVRHQVYKQARILITFPVPCQ